MPELIVSRIKGRLDPADIKLQELSEKGNYKQALADIEKRLKKAPTDRLLVNKAFVLYNFHDRKLRPKVHEILEDVAGRDSVTNDKAILAALDGFASTCICPKGFQEKVHTLWDKALKTSVLDEDFALEAFESRLLDCDFELSQKIAQSQMKKSRIWRMRYIIATYLAGCSPVSKNPNKAVLGTLALKFLEKDAQNALKEESTAKELLTPSPDSGPYKVDVMRGRREFSLAVGLLRKDHEIGRALNLLDPLLRYHPDLDLAAFYMYVMKPRLEMLRAGGEWTRLWTGCEAWLQIIKRDTKARIAVGLNDWTFWAFVATAAANCGTTKTTDDFRRLIEIHSETNGNARLAHVLFAELRSRNGKSSSMEVAKLCVDYFKYAKDKPSVFRDLKIAYLGADSTALFIECIRNQAHENYKAMKETKASRRSWLLTEINTLKQEYYRTLTNPTNLRNNSRLLGPFASLCLDLYDIALLYDLDFEAVNEGSQGSSAGERHPGDDAAILAAMALVHIYFETGNFTLLTCTLILERVLARSPHNYDAGLLAVRLYLYLGLPDPAVRIFRRLDIKNLQHLSTSWILTTRLSTLNPHSGEVADFLADNVRTIGKLYRTTKDVAHRYLEYSTWDNLLHHFATFEEAKYSMPSCIATAEHATCMILRKDPSWIDRRRDVPLESQNDPREHTAFPNYEHSQSDALEPRLSLGPKPQKPWAFMRLQLHDLRHRIVARVWHDAGTGQSDIWKTENRQLAVGADLLGPEQLLAYKVWGFHDLMALMVASFDGNHATFEAVQECTIHINRYLDADLQIVQVLHDGLEGMAKELLGGRIGPHFLSYEIFSQATITFESLQLTDAFLAFLTKEQTRGKFTLGFKPDWLTLRTDKHRSSMLDVSLLVRNLARTIRDALQDPTIVDSIIGFVVSIDSGGDATSAKMTFDNDRTPLGLTIREHCLDLIAGWRSSFDGLAQSAELLVGYR